MTNAKPDSGNRLRARGREESPLPTAMKTSSILTLAGLCACATWAAAQTPTIPPKITSPLAGATASTAVPMIIKVDSGSLTDVSGVQILSNGVPIGWAIAPNLLGEWAFPAEAHLSVMKPDPTSWPDAPPIIMDYHPDGTSPMMFFSGDFVSPTQFTGTYETNHEVPYTGNVTVDFTRVNEKINIVITGDGFLGTRTHNSGVCTRYDRTVYSYRWLSPKAGSQNLRAKLFYTNTTTWQPDEYLTASVLVTVTTPPAPEIVVIKGGISLKDNLSTTNFGKIPRGSRSVPVTYTIRNTGNAKLTNLKVELKGTNVGDFVATQPLSVALAPGAKTTFTVRFVPRQKGVRTAVLRILSNDADENPFRVALTGTGT